MVTITLVSKIGKMQPSFMYSTASKHVLYISCMLGVAEDTDLNSTEALVSRSLQFSRGPRRVTSWLTDGAK